MPCGLNAIHYRHLDIHKDQLVSFKIAAAIFLEALLHHFKSYLAVFCLLNVNIKEIVLDDSLQCHNVELLIINYEDALPTIAVL